jgi:polyferredoxin
MWRILWIPWRWWRRAAQLALFVGFLWLFRRTEFTGVDQLAGGENLLFRLDPLVGAAAMLGARQLIAAFWPAVILLGFTLIFGRFFCGWMCPLGTLLDYFQAVVRPFSFWRKRQSPADGKSLTTSPILKSTRYVVLIVVLLAAVFAFPLVGLVDPFSLLVRGMTFWGDPMFYRGIDAAFGHASEGWATEVLQPWVQKHVMPFRANVFQFAWASATLLGILFVLELVAPRFWCRYLCPTGAVFGLFSRWSLVKRVPMAVCKNCGRCGTDCRMDAVDRTSGFAPEACTLCMDCVDFCPSGIARFKRKRSATTKTTTRPVDLTRREVLTGIAAGAAIPGVALAAKLGHPQSVSPTLLRPPGVENEKTFLNLCIRCGECMKVCPTNVLQPVFFKAGVEGLFSPHLIPRLIFQQSYCEYTCTLCSQVCPTGAIPKLTEELKHARPNAKAFFDHSLCLPWAEKTPCIRCEEMCPAPDKAIKIFNTMTVTDKDGQQVEIQQPYVERDLCVGCGICESNCTLEGVSGIRLQRIDAPDPKTEPQIQGKKPQENPKPSGNAGGY